MLGYDPSTTTPELRVFCKKYYLNAPFRFNPYFFKNIFSTFARRLAFGNFLSSERQRDCYGPLADEMERNPLVIVYFISFDMCKDENACFT